MAERGHRSCNPRFFRVLLPGFSEELPIPHAFASKHIAKEKCMAKATLVNPNGGSWNVDLYTYKDVNRDRIMYFGGEGWLELAQAHNLGIGSFLVFRYRGNMLFSFRAYDLSTCEISYCSSSSPAKQKKKKKQQQQPLKGKNGGAILCQQKVINSCSKKRKMMEKQAPEASNSEEEKDKPKKMKLPSGRARASLPCNVGAYFEASIWPINLRSPYMNIPVKFSDANGLTERGEVILVDPEGRWWPVQLLHRRRGDERGSNRNASMLTRGWLEFARGNKLKLEDKCVFEVQVGDKELMMRVHIGLQLARLND